MNIKINQVFDLRYYICYNSMTMRRKISKNEYLNSRFVIKGNDPFRGLKLITTREIDEYGEDKYSYKKYIPYYLVKSENIFFKDDELLSFLKEKIIKDIGLENIPYDSFISGGYILGLVLEYLKISETKHRDIDIFFNIDPSVEGIKDVDLNHFFDTNKGIDFYSFYEKSGDYEILTQYKKEKYNYIKITAGSSFKWENFLKDFDLNCVFIGVEIFNKEFKLVYTEEFIDFLHTNEIILYDRSSYLSSIPRSIRKLEQYPFLKFDLHYFLKKMIIKESNGFVNTYIEYPNYLSEENRRKLQKIFKNEEKYESDEKGFLIKGINEDYHEFFNQFNNYLESHSYPYLKKEEIRRLKKFDDITNYRNETNTYICNFLKELFLNYNFFFKDIKKEELISLNNFIKKHNDIILLRSLTLLSENIDDWTDFISLIRRIKSNNDLIAFIENNNISKEVDSYNSLIKYKKKCEREKYNFKYRKLNNISWIKKYCTELDTSEKLNEESKLMKHCVSGYWSYVASGKQRIFHINYDGEKSTISLDYKTGKIIQHKSKHNKKPSKINLFIGNVLSNNYKFFK